MDGIQYKPKAGHIRIRHTIDTPGAKYKPLYFQPFSFEDGLVRQVAAEWLNYLREDGTEPVSISKLRKSKETNIQWTNEQGDKQIKKVNFSKVVSVIKEHKYFFYEPLGIPVNAKIPWADQCLTASMDHYWPDNQNKIPGDTTLITLVSGFGEQCPLRPSIDREGICYAPLLTYLYKIIINSRKYLVENSDQMFSFDEIWVQNLFSFLNSFISLVESTLVQIYYQAKYDKKNENGLGEISGLKFDAEKIGPTTTGRALEKIHWLYLCTGRHIEKVDDEIKNIKFLKEIRNHVNHFDPPVFACTAEDLAYWLNITHSLASFLWKVRRLIQLPPSQELCSLLFLPKVAFLPRNPVHLRGRQKSVSGYASCLWPVTDTCSVPIHLTPEQCRGARAMLNWSPTILASRANLPEKLIIEYESGIVKLNVKQISIIRNVFQSAGITFLPGDDHGEGIRFSPKLP